MVEPLRHRQTKGAATDMFYLTPPRHISTLHKTEIGPHARRLAFGWPSPEPRRTRRARPAATTSRRILLRVPFGDFSKLDGNAWSAQHRGRREEFCKRLRSGRK